MSRFGRHARSWSRRCHRRGGERHHRHWIFQHTMRRRVFRWLFLSTLATVGAVAVALHFVGPDRLRWLVVPAFWVLGVSSSIIARRLSRSLEQVARFADALSAGRLDARIPLGRHDEHDLVIVQAALNRMAERIAQQMADQRALLGAVSHELRSPLQRMRLAIELVRGGDLAPLAKLEREVGDMDQMVGDLLAGSRLDFGAQHPRQVEATELALAVLERVEEPPDKLNVEARGLTFSADPTLVLHAVTNLVENARRHGGGLVELRISRRDAAVRFAAFDDGPGFAADELERVFLPFRQTSTAQSIGLGLSIVRRIAEAHGGRALAANRPGGGAEVAIELPLAAKGSSGADE